MTTTLRLNEATLFRRILARAITPPVFLLIMLAQIFLWQLNSLLDAHQWVDHIVSSTSAVRIYWPDRRSSAGIGLVGSAAPQRHAADDRALE
jgi:hypothetical protein